jgi:hypothetical protein
LRVDPKLLAQEAKAIVLLAFRNGLLEELHAGKPCPTCHSNPEYSHITQAEMRQLMKQAVNRVYSLLWYKAANSKEYRDLVEGTRLLTATWDEPRVTTKF